MEVHVQGYTLLPLTEYLYYKPLIYIGCSLIQHQYPVVPEHGSGQTDQLSLPHTQVGPSLLNGGF